MAKKIRHRAPRGPEKTKIVNFRCTPETRRALEKSAETSGRTVSGECEHQLHRALFEMGGGYWPMLKAISVALDTVPAVREWGRDPVAFDRVRAMIVAALDLFRPPGPGTTADEKERERARAAVLDLMIEMARAEVSASLVRQPARQRGLANLKQDLGGIAGAEPMLGELTRLVRRAMKGGEPAPTAEDALRLWQLTAAAVQLIVHLMPAGLAVGAPEIGAPTLTVSTPKDEEK